LEQDIECADLWCTGHYPECTGHCPVHMARTLPNRPLSGFCWARSTIIHRTVRCAPDCPVSQPSNGSLRANERLCRATVVNSASAEVRGHWTVRCAHRQQTSPTARKWLGAIKPPNHLIQSHPSILSFSFIARAKCNTPRHNQSNQSSPSLQINSIPLKT
jgi:hypothetical protein